MSRREERSPLYSSASASCARSSERILTAREPTLRFDQENCETRSDRDHRGDEEEGDRGAEMRLGQAGREQEYDDCADQDRGKHAEEDRLADQRHPAVEDADLAQPPVVLAAAACQEQRLDLPSPIDDPREAARADVQECPIPASRKTGATASWMICATVVTDVGEVGNMRLLMRGWVRLWKSPNRCPCARPPKCLKSLLARARQCMQIKRAGACL